MQEVELTWGRVLHFFWAIVWRSFAIGIPFAIIMGMVSGAIIAMMGLPNFTVSPWFTTVETLIFLPLYPVILRGALRAKFSDFRIALVPPKEPAPVVREA